MFGTTQPPATKPLFGATGSGATTGGLFGTTSAAPSQPAAGPTLFGSGSTAAPAAGGLFGGARPASASGNLFGGGTATPSSAGTLFGGGAAPAAAANPAGTLFGNAGTPSSAGTLFGTPAAKPASTQAPSLLGNQASSAAATSAPAAGSLFGTATTQPASQSPGPSLFNTAPKPASNLFGAILSNQPTSSQPATSSQPTTSAQPPAIPAVIVTPAAQNSAVASFGKPAATSAASPATTTATASNAAAPSLFGGFGGATSQAAANTTTQTRPSLFNVATHNAASSASPFGNTTNQASTNQPAPLFASLGTAGPTNYQPQQQIVPGVKIDLSNIKPTTRYFELHDDLQKEIDNVDNFIQQQIQFFTQCGAFMPEHGNQLQTIPQDVEFVQKRYETTTVALERDAADISAVQAAIQVDIEDARRVFTAIENQKLPLQFQYSTTWPAATGGPGVGDGDGSGAFTATDLLPYFEARSAELGVQLERYGAQMAEIEAHLRTVETSATEQMQRLLRRNGNSGSRSGGEDGAGGRERVADLVDAMRTFEEAVLRVAARVGEARQGVIECTLDGSALANGNGRGLRLR